MGAVGVVRPAGARAAADLAWRAGRRGGSCRRRRQEPAEGTPHPEVARYPPSHHAPKSATATERGWKAPTPVSGTAGAGPGGRLLAATARGAMCRRAAGQSRAPGARRAWRATMSLRRRPSPDHNTIRAGSATSAGTSRDPVNSRSAGLCSEERSMLNSRSQPAVFVLAAGERAEEFDQSVGGRAQARLGAGVGVGRGQGFPDEVADVRPGGGGEPAQVEAVVSGQAQALAQAGDQQQPVRAGSGTARPGWRGSATSATSSTGWSATSSVSSPSARHYSRTRGGRRRCWRAASTS